MFLSYPFNTQELRAAGELREPAYTYALIHQPTGRVHFGYATNMRTCANMWASRLRNPDGNSKVPRTWMPPAWTDDVWTPDQWALKIGKGYLDEQRARVKFHDAIAKARANGTHVLNRDRALPHFMLTTEVASILQTAGMPRREQATRALEFPHELGYEQRQYAWPVLLDWILVVNRCRNPTDAQVKALWIAYHASKGEIAPSHVYDPDRQKRRDNAERRRVYNRNAAAVRKGLRPRTWGNYQG